MLDVPPAAVALAEQASNDLGQLGFSIEPFGPRQVLVRGVPGVLVDRQPQRVVQETLVTVATNTHGLVIEQHASWAERLALVLACKSAVRAGDTSPNPKWKRCCAGSAKQPCAAPAPTAARPPSSSATPSSNASSAAAGLFEGVSPVEQSSGVPDVPRGIGAEACAMTSVEKAHSAFASCITCFNKQRVKIGDKNGNWRGGRTSHESGGIRVRANTRPSSRKAK